MNVRSRFFVNVGRLLALAGAVALGSALAFAQQREALPDTAPSTPTKSKGDPEDPTRSRNQPSAERNPGKVQRETQPRTNAQPNTDERPKIEGAKKSADQPAVRTEDPTRGSAVRRGANERGETEATAGQTRRTQGFGIQFGEQAQGALSITNIEAESDAARAGFQPGDRIVSVDGRNLTSPRQFQAYLSGQSGRTVPVIIERGGQRYTIQFAASQSTGDGPWLGVYLQDNEENQTGARIISVFPSGPAARAGLRPGDVVQQVNGQEIASTPDFIATIDGLEPRGRAELVVQRGDQQLKVPVVLGSRESFVFHRQRDAESGNNYNGDDEFADVPPYAMELEHDRRMAEQHQRIETELRKLQEEIRQLREVIEQRK